MNRSYLDMVHLMGMTTNAAAVKGMEMSVLEQQKLALNRQHEQLLKMQQQEELSFYDDFSMLSSLPARNLIVDCGQRPEVSGAIMNEIMDRPIKADPSTENRWADFAMQQSGVTVEHSGVESAGQVNSPCYGTNYTISRTTSLQPIVSVVTAAMKMPHNNIIGRDNLPSQQSLSGETGRENSKKRKTVKSLMTPEVREEDGSVSKRSKGCPEEEESRITAQNSNRCSSQSKQKEISGNNNNRKNKETSGCTSKDTSKASEVQKTDYIHVRARRGQATDSHSLAERVRREKISERMRYLQDLVPGCSKITGKAGMLDEIINYVQSLQRQVEFLSMKLAAASPSLDFDDLIAKEVLAACSRNLPTIGVSPDLINSNYLQYNSIQQMEPVCRSEVGTTLTDMGLRTNNSVPVSMPETYFDTSCFNQITNYLQWDADLQNNYNTEFQQGRSTPFQSQLFTGVIEANCLKTEM